ncbi:PKD repeat protein/glucose/arabinose dehydrogenase/type 1 glutamine amidotransferase [Nocardioides marinisabuli]|uniref:PKD repeat protein/glucose/arabinose dehydrogenase/type 1 glutamine amidotransferase n=1 Tax=Nocardioides marinisabuli TaxID=419476 RepID=A0A7Y9JQG2_9ACTN|nr:ThuA domain-containing protein [Nocardioides marinisabuli]NYD57415.1 PKD repeat protein/glucose/arabinose dehydrogenase/type 1 glutamine amidotransferase [Nocardioides marinisabuli]
MTYVVTRLRSRARALLTLAVAMLVGLPLAGVWLAAPAQAHEGHGETDPFRALVFSKTSGFRHGSITAGVNAIKQLGVDHEFTVDATEDAGDFTEANLAQYDVVVWLSTTGDVLNASQQAAFEGYIRDGGGYAGIHAASDTEYDWEWYGDLVGAYFKGHPAQQQVTVKVEDPAHPSTAELPALWNRFDELYNYRTNPRGKLHVLASLDEATYNGGDMGVEHPITWCQDYDGGRAWYTGLGHTDASFADPLFLDHLLGGIRTAAGVLPADCSATLPASFEKVTLDDNTQNPMELAIAPDGRVVYVDRNGAVKIILTNGNVVTAGSLNVYTGQEFGLLGVALDLDFDDNGWVYLYHSPAGASAIDRVSRITLSGNTLDMSTKKDVLDIPVQRDQCCHAGGALEFDNDGNLYIATGDNTNPFASGGYSPMDEGEGRSAWDAQRTSGNTFSLSGKVLRITPTAAGGYTVPDGNLFEPGTAKTKPEIYAMGFRNPFRIGLDERTGALLVADYGPDAGSANAQRGPDGRVEWNILDRPGNYGWPFCVGANTPYNDYDFVTQTSGPVHDCDAPVNDSPNNTGLTQLPPAIGAAMWQGKSSSGNPEIGNSGAPMTSGTYAYDPELDSDRKWPAYFDNKAIWADWNNSRLFTVQLDAEGSAVTDVNRFLPDLPMTRPHALQFGPDGALYMIEWGSGFGGNNANSGIYRIDYVQGNRAPIAKATADVTSGAAPLTVAFDSAGSRDPDGTPLTFAWDFDGDGTTDSTEPTASHTYTEVGDYTARLTVTDAGERTAVSNIDIVVGNTAPEVELVLPLDGGFFSFGDTMRYEVVVTDAEDEEIDCDNVVVQPALGHDEHAHGYEQYRGCSGTVPLPGDEGHVGANIFGTITATYTDGGGEGVGSLTGQDTVVLHTKRTEAEYFQSTGRLADSTSSGTPGVQTETTGDTAGGGKNVSYVEGGDWFGWDRMNLTNIDQISMRAASSRAGGATWEVRTGEPTGPTVATIAVPRTAGWQVYGDYSAEPTGPSTEVSGPLYFVQTTGGSNINWIDFIGRGVTDNEKPQLSATADPVTGLAPLEVDFTSSVSDPDGDDPVSVEWDFGDGAGAESADATHTYTTPGTYAAKVTATDARGAEDSKTFAITVQAEPDTCFTGRSDDFVGDSLDTDRWDSIVRPSGNATVSGSHLSIPLTATDIHGANGTPTPDIVLQHLPGGAFEVTTKVTLEARRQYQQAGLIVYGDDDNYLKMVLQGRTGSPSAAGRVFQFAGELAGRATETNTPALGEEFPDTFWVRMSSPDGLDVTASYSSDGITFTEMDGTRSLSGINEPRVGVFGLANRTEALPITAHFDHFRITPDDTATSCDAGGETCFTGRSDGFDGDALDTQRWDSVVRANQDLTVSDGLLSIPLTATDIYGTNNTGTPNIVLQDLPDGEFEVTTKVTLEARRQWQQAGLIIYGDDDNYLKMVKVGRASSPDAAARRFQLTKEVEGSATEDNTPDVGAGFPDTYWVRLSSTDGESVTGSYSADGVSFTEMSRSFTLAGIAGAKVGVFGLANKDSALPVTAEFDHFLLTPDDTATPCEEEEEEEEEDTTEPQVGTTVLGDYAGELVSLVDTEIGGEATLVSAIDGDARTTSATLSLTGLEPAAGYESHLHVGTCDTLGLHYRDDPEGDGTPPNELWPTTPGWESGPRIVAGEDGRAEAAATVAWAPRTDGRSLVLHRDGAIVACATLDLTGPGTVVLDATDDATDDTGVDTVEHRVDGGEWTTYEGPFEISEPGTHTVDYRVSDLAGNTTQGSLDVVVPEPDVEPVAPTVEIAVSPEEPDGDDGWYTGPVTVTPSATGGVGELNLEQRVGSDEWAPYVEPVVVSEDGSTTVAFRATDEEDTASEVVSTEVRVDQTAPVVRVERLTQGQVLSVAAVRRVRVLTQDETAGVASTVVRLDGQVVDAPVDVDAVALLSGKHRLEVRVVDAAGNRTTEEVVFRVAATYRGGRALLNRLEGEGRISVGLDKLLGNRLDKAQRKDRQGKEAQARKTLVKFVRAARRADDQQATRALVDLGRVLRSQV